MRPVTLAEPPNPFPSRAPDHQVGGNLNRESWLLSVAPYTYNYNAANAYWLLHKNIPLKCFVDKPVS